MTGFSLNCFSCTDALSMILKRNTCVLNHYGLLVLQIPNFLQIPNYNPDSRLYFKDAGLHFFWSSFPYWYYLCTSTYTASLHGVLSLNLMRVLFPLSLLFCTVKCWRVFGAMFLQHARGIYSSSISFMRFDFICEVMPLLLMSHNMLS